MKEQIKTPELKELKKKEISNLSDAEFKTLLIRMLIELRRRVDEQSENFNKKIENIKKNQSEMKNTLIEMKNTLQGINCRVD